MTPASVFCGKSAERLLTEEEFHGIFGELGPTQELVILAEGEVECLHRKLLT